LREVPVEEVCARRSRPTRLPHTNEITPSTAPRTISFQVNDGGAVNNLSNVATRDVTVAFAAATRSFARSLARARCCGN
jgi:hypothetical protein